MVRILFCKKFELPTEVFCKLTILAESIVSPSVFVQLAYGYVWAGGFYLFCKYSCVWVRAEFYCRPIILSDRSLFEMEPLLPPLIV